MTLVDKSEVGQSQFTSVGMVVWISLLILTWDLIEPID